MASVPKLLDYAAYLKTPETTRRYDIVDGEFRFMSPAPDVTHQQTVLRVSVILDRHVERFPLGEAFVSPVDVIISKGPMRTRPPDVLYISRSRRHLIQAQIEGGPDLVVEILSPGNTPKRVQEKLWTTPRAVYSRPGCSIASREPSASGARFRACSNRPGSTPPASTCGPRSCPCLRLPVERVFPRQGLLCASHGEGAKPASNTFVNFPSLRELVC